MVKTFFPKKHKRFLQNKHNFANKSENLAIKVSKFPGKNLNYKKTDSKYKILQCRDLGFFFFFFSKRHKWFNGWGAYTPGSRVLE